MESFKFAPIGHFVSSLENPNEAPRQPNNELLDTSGVIQLLPGFNFEEALRDLDGFSKVWILYHFHRNEYWNPTVSPPRGSLKKRGVFATRSPYRPNPIGMSVLDLKNVDGLTVTLGPSDLLNGTPILDLKPYLPYMDSYPNARIGWLENQNEAKYSLIWSPLAIEQNSFLESLGITQLKGFILNHLEYEPENFKKKRLYFLESKILLAYRTWRIEFKVDSENKQVSILHISSAYSSKEIEASTDPYKDKPLHLAFISKYGNRPHSTPS